jgi:hypothetical protein
MPGSCLVGREGNLHIMKPVRRFLATLKHPAPWLALLAVTAVVAATYLAILGHVDYANLALTVLVFVVTVATLWVVIPKDAHVTVVRPDELEIADLVFFLQSGSGAHPELPADVLLQLHVAVINDGGRKVLLSGLRLVGLIHENGDLHFPPGFPEALNAQLYLQVTRRRSSTGMRVEVESETAALPVVLAPDDVVVLRFRARRGIDWSPSWTLEQVRRFADNIGSPIKGARLQLRYRHGKELSVAMIDVPCDVDQQERYRRLLEVVTDGFHRLPAVEPLSIEVE